jgi:hypothetical protein
MKRFRTNVCLNGKRAMELFSVAISGVEDTTNYIQSQKEYHARHSFKYELIAFLDKHGIKYEAWMLD